MASSVNKVILLGNVGKDPEYKALPSGTGVVNFTLATNEKFKDRSGEQQERTEWHNCQAFERTAEVVRDYVKKGSKLYIEGKIQTRSWDDQSTGEKRYRTEILVRQVTLPLWEWPAEWRNVIERRVGWPAAECRIRPHLPKQGAGGLRRYGNH